MSARVIPINRKKEELTREEARRREKYLAEHAVAILRELLWSWKNPAPAK